MKKFVTGFIAGAFIFGSIGVFAEVSPIKLIVNGQEINSDVPPQVIDGRTMVPARALVEALGATAKWDDEKRAVIVNTVGGTPTDLNPVSSPSLTPEEKILTSGKKYFGVYGYSGGITKFNIEFTDYDKDQQTFRGRTEVIDRDDSVEEIEGRLINGKLIYSVSNPKTGEVTSTEQLKLGTNNQGITVLQGNWRFVDDSNSGTIEVIIP
ncbi:copper amine oxidase N-terminal domain-containing protein [Ammoniphilus resinae]|uniref:Copper amine oxidase-like N-terminal domain-containing protein n=1 Tax=Ammoniphilus resinae TaxID=861532 RepID=A0ABS4GXS9_9BACL|nr:copper amine oxidase N-terminal domain-containing protein [Ammoniphilus resinae]MBP1934837.1 hypothetical protein [Ammoniphilus resinae]